MKFRSHQLKDDDLSLFNLRNLTCPRFVVVAVLVFSFCSSGCGSSEYKKAASDSLFKRDEESNLHSMPEKQEIRFGQAGEKDSISTGGKNSVKTERRKIIFTAKVTTIVEDLNGVGNQVEKVAEELGGYVASTKLSSLSSYRPSGTWVIRVPVDKFQEFLSSAKTIGTVESSSTNSQDVTEEFFDSEARLKNQRKLEQRILKLLERPEDEIQHVIKVEAELARIREVIERIEGRLRFLKDRTSFSTVTLTVIQQKSYVPKEKRTFSTRLSSAWEASWNDAWRGGENFLIRADRQSPFWIFFVVIILPASVFILRWLRRKLVS